MASAGRTSYWLGIATHSIGNEEPPRCAPGKEEYAKKDVPGEDSDFQEPPESMASTVHAMINVPIHDGGMPLVST